MLTRPVSGAPCFCFSCLLPLRPLGTALHCFASLRAHLLFASTVCRRARLTRRSISPLGCAALSSRPARSFRQTAMCTARTHKHDAWCGKACVRDVHVFAEPLIACSLQSAPRRCHGRPLKSSLFISRSSSSTHSVPHLIPGAGEIEAVLCRRPSLLVGRRFVLRNNQADKK